MMEVGWVESDLEGTSTNKASLCFVLILKRPQSTSRGPNFLFNGYCHVRSRTNRPLIEPKADVRFLETDVSEQREKDRGGEPHL